ncbi:Nif3-like dinuclear metal center hexameric protein [Deinococcus sonorensis]|uniref:Nif3-like dinuclear metal center hexameric protein n=2 Tax=Deinococcus sonorensis TaxID=309891 RepID=A0AAU7UG07_9DEIO
MAALEQVAAWLAQRLDEREPVVRRPGGADIRALVLALEPDDLPGELNADAIFLHRSFRLADDGAGRAVLASHDGFDRTLTTGENRTLAARMGWSVRQTLTWQGQPVGLLADLEPTSWAGLVRRLDHEYGGHDRILTSRTEPVSRLALVNAMRPELLEWVTDLGASVYLTGQLRPGAVRTAEQLGLGVVALGHRRSEQWGLHQLARELRVAFPDLQVRVMPD